MHLRLFFGIHLMLLGAAIGQVSSSTSDLEKGLLERWDGVLPLDGEKPLKLPNPTHKSELQDFAIAFAFRVESAPDAEHGNHILALGNESQKPLIDWHLGSQGVGITLEDRGLMHAVPLSPPITGRWWHVVLNVKRDAKQALTGIWLNGIELNSWREPPGPLLLANALFEPNSRGLGGQIAHLRLYDRALTRPEILELAALPTGAALKRTLTPWAAGKGIMTNEVLAILGGSEAVAVVEDGSMETQLVAQHPIKLRDLTWEADTVFRQDRPMNFGSLRQQLERSGATAAMLIFGRQECLERGESGLAEFKTSLEKLVSTCTEVTPRIVLVHPPAFEGKLAQHNAALKQYAAVIAEVARAHGALVAAPNNSLQPGSTRDGLNLTSTGASQLGLSIAQLWSSDSKAPDATLRSLIQQKNALWHRYWRPANWAFLHGDRTAQPSSRNHADPAQRWFPSELEQYLPLIEAKESEIAQRANELGGKLP
ncbi:hypothetical protein [Prosthecobacter sp.]|uniref:hypothetical protein n=1 Tax=Prosthecobacter sp. TaxID=1965333 RepID=UPI003782D3D9